MNNVVARKLNGLLRSILCHAFSGPGRYLVVTEYPKSGGTWFSQMLGALLDLPFPRNRFPMLRSSIIHGHYVPRPGLRRPIVVVRDGRDVMISLYHHALTLHANGLNRPLVERVRRRISFDDAADVSGNLPRFIEFAFGERNPFGFTWASFNEAWLQRQVHWVRYEDLLEDAGRELISAIESLGYSTPSQGPVRETVERFSFTRITGRAPGEENRLSFLRKGVAGEWRGVYSRRAAAVFEQAAGDVLRVLGYEMDAGWVEQLED